MRIISGVEFTTDTISQLLGNLGRGHRLAGAGANINARCAFCRSKGPDPVSEQYKFFKVIVKFYTNHHT